MDSLVPSQTNSSDYFDDDDPGFLEALQTTVLPGDTAADENNDGSHESQELEPPPPSQPSLKRRRLEAFEERHNSAKPTSWDDDIYGASNFGAFSEYMHRKRSKLQIQNSDLRAAGESVEGSKLFRGLAIYINGYTQPSVQELRQLIVQHGGIFRPYLDKKAIVTHIITCSLTPAKIHEFQHMKVVRPQWLVESAREGTLLPWKNYIFRTEDRLESIQGTRPRHMNIVDALQSVSYENETAVSPKPETAPKEPTSAPGSPDPLQDYIKPSGREPDLSLDQDIPSDADSPDSSTAPPKYAAHKSNPLAQRVMANRDWRKAHTSAAPDFIEGYYKNSRLHHLSAWKAELKNLVLEAQERAENGGSEELMGRIDSEVFEGGADGVSMRGVELVMKSPGKGKGKGKEKAVDDRVIMHCDFDCFFVSAGLVSRPHLRGKPVVVCHSQGAQGGASSTSEIASASYEARKFGIRNGMSLQQARKLCPSILTMPYEFETYKQLSLKFYTILMSQADDLQAVSVDEALIDVTTTVTQLRSRASQSSTIDPTKDFAETIRAQVRKATGCEVSIGISHNILLARLATRRAKPAGSYHLNPSEVTDFLAPLDISDLHGFGSSTKHKAQEKLGVTILGELMDKSKGVLCDALGKSTGETLYNALRGIDEKRLESDKPRKSVSCEINYGIRFENNKQAELFIYQMSEEITKRLNDIGMVGRSINLKVMKRDPTAPVEPPKFLGHGACDLFNKQIPLIGAGGKATSDEMVIGEHAWRLLKSFNFDPRELRGLGIQIQKLESRSSTSTIQPGQAMLPFRRVGSPQKAPSTIIQPLIIPPGLDSPQKAPSSILQPSAIPQILVHAPLQDIPGVTGAEAQLPLKEHHTVELPSFSQVDIGVFNALPPDVRKELETEYKRRSTSPAIPGPPARTSVPPPHIFHKPVTVKGPNYKRIARQLAPKNGPNISPHKYLLFKKRQRAGAVHMSDEELRKLGFDPEVFGMLPPNLQHEQLTMARLIRDRGSLPDPPTKRKVLKPLKRKPIPAHLLWRAPAPKARHIQPPLLRQQGKERGEKFVFTETGDIQDLIGKWVDTYRRWAPKPRDVEFFTKYLVEAVDGRKNTDVSLERAIAIMKWWMVLLRRHWGGSELVEEEGAMDPSQMDPVGQAWWQVFREVKGKMDEVARRRFGGQLSLK